MTSKKGVKTDGVVFDDDTSDSDGDENIQVFNTKVAEIAQPLVNDKEEEGYDEEEGSESETDHESSSEESDEESDTEITPAPKEELSEEKIDKLSKLKQQLANISKDDSNSESSSDISDYEDSNDVGHEVNSKVPQNAPNSDSDEESEASGDEGQGDTDKTSLKRQAVAVDSSSPAKKIAPSTETSEERARAKYREQLSKMSIEEIQKLKEKLGLKLFHQKMSGTAPVRGKKVDFKRENKNRPREMSSKKTVGRFREVVAVAKVERRDPRFDPLCGEFDKDLFKESYKFVNEIKSKELSELKKQIREEQDPERRKSIKYLIQRTENQLRSEAQNQVRQAEKEEKTKERKDQLREGIKPVFLSKSKQKEVALVEQYEKLKETGGLDTYIRKKTKKNLVRDRKRFENLS